ncbi:GcrA cell cycle regulator (plasmid) [Paracoccus sp. TK19116]|uniref:GcrA cell cycle regulator n=1 Tax=Paracoccus albicereus TaxID=2922394 RepID=A0ABT1MM34_9RHOB|nr:GcrA family cell cycle regulator [Paracoccus albicereus]MCQ0968839.1 GcrA cell cycle regulator [Paracoccus albicereus]
MSWTDERVETLKRMWSEGQSASAIAKELGGVTRNAVIGKVHRLGLSNRDEAEPVAAVPEAAPEPVAEKKAAPKPARKPAVTAVETEETASSQPEAAEAAEPQEEPAAQPAFSPVARRPVITAGQPLPPQPSANEISPEALASVREVEKKARKLTLMELTERTCKWPIGDPATDKFWFCGLPSQPGKPYCEAHVGVAFQPMSSRRDRRR